MRRFWNEISLAALAEGFTLCFDGRQMRLSDGAALLLPRRRVAEAVAAEWRALGEEFSPDDLPLTRLAGTARNRIAPDPAPTIAALARYGASDLLCYRAEAPARLAERQEILWQPWLDWAARALDAPLAVTAGLMPIAQPPASLAALEATLAAQDAETLAALGVMVPALGSLVLGLAVALEALPAAAAHDLAELESDFQAEIWGLDRAARARRARIGGEIAEAARFLGLAREEEA
uniref:ATPase n=1 Tax=Acidicaldus sp. TaxID=1872105 RepID=A0A8J4M5U0_9PROT